MAPVRTRGLTGSPRADSSRGPDQADQALPAISAEIAARILVSIAAVGRGMYLSKTVSTTRSIPMDVTIPSMGATNCVGTMSAITGHWRVRRSVGDSRLSCRVVLAARCGLVVAVTGCASDSGDGLENWCAEAEVVTTLELEEESAVGITGQEILDRVVTSCRVRTAASWSSSSRTTTTS